MFGVGVCDGSGGLIAIIIGSDYGRDVAGGIVCDFCYLIAAFGALHLDHAALAVVFEPPFFRLVAVDFVLIDLILYR